MRPTSDRTTDTTVTFDPRDLPCSPLTYVEATITDMVRHWELLGRPAYGAFWQEIVRDLPPLTAADALHRYLLDCKRTYGSRGWRAREVCEAALRLVRPHSTLYTPRTCGCRDKQWAELLRAVDTTLGPLNGDPDRPPLLWWCESRDRKFNLPPERLTAHAALALVANQNPRYVSSKRLAGSFRGPVTVTIAEEPEPKMHITVGKRDGRSRSRTTFHRLDQKPTNVAYAISRYTPRPAAVAGLSQVEIDIALTWIGDTSGGRELAQRLTRLSVTGIRDLDPQQQDLAVALSAQWTGTEEELVQTAIAATSAVTA